MFSITDIKKAPLQSIWNYIALGYFKSVTDKGMLFADFVLATLLPYSIQYLIWGLIYAHSKSILDFNELQLMVYYAFAIAFSRLNNGYNTVETISNSLSEGTLDTYLLKPLPLPLQKYGEFLGQSALYWLPIFLLVFVQSFLSPSNHNLLVENKFYFAAILMTFLLAQLLCFLMSFFLSLLAFWIERSEFILATLSMSSAFFGGTLLPPNYWPDWMKPIMIYNPYRYMIAAPAEMLSRFNAAKLGEIIFALICYIVILSFLTLCVWRQALKKYSSVGG